MNELFFMINYNDGKFLRSDRGQTLSLASSVTWDVIFFII